MNALDLFRAGKLREATEACVNETRQRPTDPVPRDLLAQMLCFAGEYERADKHLAAMSIQFPERAPAIALIRQLVRAAEAREQFFEEGHFPEPVCELTPVIRQCLEASLLVREDDLAGAHQLLVAAERQRPRLKGTCNGLEFNDLRDVTDLLAPVLEILTPTGKYAWVPLASVREMTLYPVESPIDVLWRHVHIVVQDGPDGDVYLPQLYFGSHAVDDQQLQVGLAADWYGGDDEPLGGLGQKVMLVGESDTPLITINELRIHEMSG